MPTLQDQVITPLPSALLVASPSASVGPDEYVTVIEHLAEGLVRTVTWPSEPRVTGDRTSVNAI